jgi:hypothetical protein
MSRPRAADDFATIRARMEELRREREAVRAHESDLPRNRLHAPPNMETGLSERSPLRPDSSSNLPRHQPRGRSGLLISA